MLITVIIGSQRERITSSSTAGDVCAGHRPPFLLTWQISRPKIVFVMLLIILEELIHVLYINRRRIVIVIGFVVILEVMGILNLRYLELSISFACVAV